MQLRLLFLWVSSHRSIPYPSITITPNPLQDGIEEAAKDSDILAKDLADILDRNLI